MYYQRYKNEKGDYIDATATRYELMRAEAVATPAAWINCESAPEAAAAFGLEYAPLSSEEPEE